MPFYFTLQGEERRSVSRKLQRLHDFSSKAVLRGGTEDNGAELFALYRLLVPGVGACMHGWLHVAMDP